MRQINVIVDSNDLDVTHQFVELCIKQIDWKEYKWNFIATVPDKHIIPSGKVSFTHSPFTLMKISYFFEDTPGSEFNDHVLLEKIATNVAQAITPHMQTDQVLTNRLEKNQDQERLNSFFALIEKNKREQYETVKVVRDTHEQLESYTSLQSQSLFKPKPAVSDRNESSSQYYKPLPKGPFLRKLGVIGLTVVGIGGLAFLAEPFAWLGGIALLTISPPAFFATLAIVLTVIAASLIGAYMLYKFDKSVERQANSSLSPA